MSYVCHLHFSSWFALYLCSAKNVTLCGHLPAFTATTVQPNIRVRAELMIQRIDECCCVSFNSTTELARHTHTKTHRHTHTHYHTCSTLRVKIQQIQDEWWSKQ